MLFKLDTEIRTLQKQAAYERNVANQQKLAKNWVMDKNQTGPMCIALNEYEKRKI